MKNQWKEITDQATYPQTFVHQEKIYKLMQEDDFFRTFVTDSGERAVASRFQDGSAGIDEFWIKNNYANLNAKQKSRLKHSMSWLDDSRRLELMQSIAELENDRGD